MFMWILFVIVICSVYLLCTHQSVDYFKDEDSGWIIPLIFFVAWAAIWYGIGYHSHKSYMMDKNAYIAAHKKDKYESASKEFKRSYLSRQSKMLSRVFFCSIPFYVALNIDDLISFKNVVIIVALMLISILLYRYYKITDN